MIIRSIFLSCSFFFLTLQGCTERFHYATAQAAVQPPEPTRVLAVYEPWFGHPRHIDVGYSSTDPTVIKKQILSAKQMGISGFVIDWYGYREPFLDKSYSLLQKIAAQQDFTVAMMYDETNDDTEIATDDALVSFEKFRQNYLVPGAPGREAYLQYRGRPVIFIFPKGGHTDWNRVRAALDRWDPPPLLIYENRPTPDKQLFDGFYAWINPGSKGWSPEGNNWGQDYLTDFYQTMRTKYPGKIAVGAAWAQFDDSKASWGLGRKISNRCGATFFDTLDLACRYASEAAMPFILVGTWNDYEEGSAIERGLPTCESTPRKITAQELSCRR
jgi:hypothetical protein